MTTPNGDKSGAAESRKVQDVLREHAQQIVAVRGSITGIEKEVEGVKTVQESMNGKLDRLLGDVAKHPRVSWKDIATTAAASATVFAVLAAFIMWFAGMQAEPIKAELRLKEAELKLQDLKFSYELQIRDERIKGLASAIQLTPTLRPYSLGGY